LPGYNCEAYYRIMATTSYQQALELAASLPREEQLRLIAELAEEKCEKDSRHAEVGKAIDSLEARLGPKPVNVEEILSARDEGRRL
jgi:hypothetical protein